MNDITPALQQRVAEISRTAPLNEIRCTAVECLGSWMNRNRQLTQTISEVLLQTREATDDTMLRGVVLQTIGNMDSPLSPAVLEAMSQAVVGENDAHNRSLAAVALGSGCTPENAAQVLVALEEAYVVEARLDTQRHIITQIAKAARDSADVYLMRLPTPDPLLAQDVRDYIEIVAEIGSGNWGAIWNRKSSLDAERHTVADGSGGNDLGGHLP